MGDQNIDQVKVSLKTPIVPFGEIQVHVSHDEWPQDNEGDDAGARKLAPYSLPESTVTGYGPLPAGGFWHHRS